MIRKHKLGKFAALGTAVACAVFVLAVGATSFASPSKTTKAQVTHYVKIPGGTMTIAEAAAGGPNYIFPMMSGQYFSVSNFQLIYLLFRPLYWFGVGSTPNLNPSISLAYDPVYTNGGKTVTIKLKNYEWSNGTPVTSKDVLFWMNMLKADVTSWAGFAPGPGQFPGDVTNVTAPNSTTVVFNLDAAYSSYWFTYNELSQVSPLPLNWDITAAGAKAGSGGCSSASYTSIVTSFSSAGALVDNSAAAKRCAAVLGFLTGKTEAGDLGTYASNPLWQIVDGPFKLSSYDATDNGASVVPNPKYSGPNPPSISKLVMAPFTTDAAEYLELEAGKTINIGYIPPQDLPTYKGAAFSKNGAPLAGKNAGAVTKNYNLEPAYPWGVNYFALNYSNPTDGAIFKQLYIRQAMQELMNQTLWIQLYSAGYGAPTYGPVPVYPPTDLSDSGETTNPYPYSPSNAANLLRKHGWTVNVGGTSTCSRPGTASNECGAGITSGEPLEFTYLYENGATSFNEQMQEQKSSFAQAGINLQLEGKSFGDVIAQAFGPLCTAGKTCGWEVANWGGGWIYSPDFYPTGEEIFATGAGSNAGGFSNATLDKLIRATNVSSSLSSLYAYENYTARELPVIWQPETALAFNEVGKNVCGFNPENPLFSWEAENWYFCKAVK
ncbi:MAG: ABC transporter substrate-binding protein [Acidimicrobiales bacterium]|jgi:peptide/nickel transport system substrate-binding protein